MEVNLNKENFKILSDYKIEDSFTQKENNIENVKKNGDQALLEYSAKFDGVVLSNIEVTDEDVKAFYAPMAEKQEKTVEEMKQEKDESHKRVLFDDHQERAADPEGDAREVR